MQRVRTNSTVYEPSVLLIVAGGTICMQDTPTGLSTSKFFLEECLSPNHTFNDGTPIPPSTVIDEHGVARETRSLRLPRDRNGANVRCAVLEFNPLLDSSTAHAPTWNQLAQVVVANEKDFDAFVICHGTDTLAYSAAALSFLLMSPRDGGRRLDKTVVLTGAQRSMFFADSDGGANLLGSIVLASHVRLPEVAVYFGHKLLRGTRITKVSASNYEGFETPNAGPLCAVSETGIVVYGDNLWSGNLAEEDGAMSGGMAGLPIMDSSKVVVIKVHPGISEDLVRMITSIPHVRGVVLETFGAGNLPVSLLPALSEAVQRGVVIVNVTQCLHGSVSVAYEPARKLADAGIVPGYDMTTEAAYTKLVYLLACKNLTPADAATKMSENICGELTPPATTPAGNGPV